MPTRASFSVKPPARRAAAAAPSPPAPPKLRIVIVEDETMFRQLILSTLGTIKGVAIVAQFGLGRPALEYCLKQPVDLLVVDLLLPDVPGLEIVRQVRLASPEMKILVITAHPSERLPAELLAIGVAGYVDKNEPIEYVVNAIDTVRRGGMFFASRVQAQRAAVPRAEQKPVREVELTAREQQIVRLVAEGKMSKEIADKLNLSHRTIENHRARIMQKVGVHEVASLTRWCIEAGLMYR